MCDFYCYCSYHLGKFTIGNIQVAINISFLGINAWYGSTLRIDHCSDHFCTAICHSFTWLFILGTPRFDDSVLLLHA